jgi:hydroxyacylglutathione hydrolase
MEFFKLEKIQPNVTSIYDLTGVYAYLVEGTERAALLDTGTGVGDLKTLVESLTTKPITVICTHGHVDHAGGAYGFETVYLNEKDFDLAEVHTTVEFRSGGIASQLKDGTLSLSDLVPQRAGSYTNLVDGQVFDLGGTTLEAIALPGHTPGMTCILVRELRALLIGDGCNPFTFLFLPESSSVQEFKTSLQHLLRHDDRYDRLWLSHGRSVVPKSIVPNCIALCDEIMAGTADNIPFEFLGQTAFIAKAMNPDYTRQDGKLGNIVFNPNKIHPQ